MRGMKIPAIVVGAAAILLVGGYVVYRVVLEKGGPAFDKSFNDSFSENCLKSAREAAAKEGRTGPEVDSVIQSRCNCALEVVRPMSAADKMALGRSEEKQREVLAEIQKRCQ